MPSIIKNIPTLLNRLFIWQALFYVIGVICTSALGSLAGMNWSTADNQTRLMVVMSTLGTISLTLRAYIDQTAQRVAKGESPFVDVPNQIPSAPPSPGTVEKTVTAQLETKTVTTPPAS